MRRFLINLTILLFIFNIGDLTHAQAITRSDRGLPPIASLISVSAPDDAGIVTVSGAVGAVFPGAQVIVRNLYTGDTNYVPAGITGSFNARLYGPGRTPFWVSASDVIPPELRDVQGALPGGPGTIIYGNTLENFANTETYTPLVIDGNTDDWQALDLNLANQTGQLLNNQSFYVVLQNELISDGFARAQLLLRIDGAEYLVNFNADNLRQVNVEQSLPTVRNRGAFAANIEINEETIEMRFPIAVIDSAFETAELIGLRLFDETDTETLTIAYEDRFLRVDQTDGPLYPERQVTGGRNFSVSGILGNGANRWSAQGRINTLALEAGDELIIELDVTLNVPEMSLSVADLTFSGDLSLQPVSTAARYANNGWSNLLTPGGLAIDNVQGDFVLTTAQTEWTYVLRKQERLIFGLQFKATIPENLPDGIYTPAFTGYVQQANGFTQTWAESTLFGNAEITGIAPITRLPVTVNIGNVDEQSLPLALLYDTPSNGTRGLLPEELVGQSALSNRVKFNTPDYILPPGEYSLEPYIPNMLANRHDLTLSPLIPLLFPAGRLTATVTRPDGTREELGNAPILQNNLSTEEINERDRFGVQSPLNMMQLSTLNPAFSNYPFDEYGTYTVELRGNTEDIWGHRYAGGGTYTITIAEPMALLPGVLPGTPFEFNDTFYTGLRVIPSYEADVRVDFRIYPLDGGEVIDHRFDGIANRHGYFIPSLEESAVLLNTAGEYVVDYHATFTDADGVQWAGSLRSAGVIASPETGIVAHGRRGLSDYTPTADEPRPAWFATQVYPQAGSTEPILNAAYHQGDIGFYNDTSTSGVKPLIQAQDLSGQYSAWLNSIIPDFVASNGENMRDNTLKDSLPLMPITTNTQNPYQAALYPEHIRNMAYGYVSAVRPGLSIRQYIHGGDWDSVRFGWYADDPFNGQIGAGAFGDRPEDYTFIFGGAIIKNDEIALNASAIYASATVVSSDAGNIYGTRVNPPFRGAMGTLFTVNNTEYEAFFTPTSISAGQSINLGEQLVIAGQTAPTLQSDVTVTITAPDGTLTTFTDSTNAIGYLYDPTNNILIDQVGVWRIQIISKTTAATSEGLSGEHLPQGMIPGTSNSTIMIYAVEDDTPPLAWNRGGNISTTTPPGGLINFSLSIPQGLVDFTPYYTISTPSFVLEQGVLRATRPAAYQYSPPQLSQDFTVIEINTGVRGSAGSDIVTLNFAVEGITENGERRLFTRTFHVLHDQLISIEAE